MKKLILTLLLVLGAIGLHAQSDIVVFNTNPDYEYDAGQTLTFSVMVTNNGPDPAQGVNVSYPIPDGLVITPGIERFTWTGNGTAGTNIALNNTIASLGVNETVTYIIEIKIPGSYNETLPEVEVSYLTQSDIEVEYTDGQETYTPGDPITYTVSVVNNGPEVTPVIYVSNVIPAGITSFSWTGNGASGTDVDLSDEITNLPIGEVVDYTITLDVPVSFTGPLDNQLSVTGNFVDLTPSCMSCTDTNLSSVGADIVVVNTNGQTIYTAGTTVVYTVTVTNAGTDDAENVVVEFTPSSGITSLTWTGDNASAGDITDLIDDTVGTLAAGDTVTYTVTADVPATFTGNLILSTIVETDTEDIDPSCDDCVDTDYETASADIVVVNTDNQDVYVAGTTSTYTVTVTNNGPTEAQNVVVQNVIPTGITSFSWTGSNTSSGTDVDLDDTIATLAVGETVTYTINLDVPATYTDALVSEVTVTSDTPDPDATCNDCVDIDYSATTDADLLITKTLNSGATYTAGLDAIYTITVTNQGPGVATNIAVQDLVPAGLTAADATWYSSNNTNGTGDLNDVIASMLPNTTVTYQFTIPVPSDFDQTTDIVNEVTVTSDTTDPTPDCPDCIHTATPNPQANLVTFKTNNQDTYIAGTNTVYTITVTNPGPSDAYNVVVYDPMPFDIDILNWQGEGTSGEGNMLTSVPVLAAGETLEYFVTVVIPDDYNVFVGPLQNIVTVSSDTPDPEPDCDTCTDIDTPAVDFVTVDKYAYTVEELVEDVLIEAECVNVSNINWSAGPLNGNFGIGYFEGNNSNFPIEDGIVIRCGTAELCEGQYNTPPNVTSSVASGNGDADLLAVSQANGNTGSINDVSYIEFDFVPLTDTMSFDFLFASNEYGTFQCGFSDVFAFLLTDETDGTVTNVNLAVIPGTTTPVSVTNIRNSLYNASCASANVDFFGQFNQGDPANSSINMRGQTVVMTASSDVIAGNTYKIKLAIGDYNDTAFDSAVFLAAGSFDIGQPELPSDLTLVSGTALCEGEEFVLSVDSENPNFVYEWEHDGEPFLDEDDNPATGTSITVTEAGTYTVLASFVSDPDCQLRDEIIVEVIPEFAHNEPADLYFFNNGVDPASFDLTSNDDVILNGIPDADFFYMSYFDVFDGISSGDAIPIFPPTTYPGTDAQTMYAGIYNDASTCVTIASFDLYVLNQPEDMTLCVDAPHDAQITIDLVTPNTDILGASLSTASHTVTYHETLIGAQDGSEVIADPANYAAIPTDFAGNIQTIYVKVQDNNDPDSFAITPFDIIVTFKAELIDFDPVVICELDDADDIATFDLTTQVDAITNASPVDMLITMHATLAAAEANEDPLTYPIYETDETENQTVFFRVLENGALDETCITYIPLELIVSPAPTAIAPADVQICDADNSGSEAFDLTTLDGTILGGLNPANYTVTYHPTLDAAENNTDAVLIPDNYMVVVGTTTLHVRLTNVFDDVCYGLTSFDITATPTPVVVVPADQFACSDIGYELPALAVGNYYTATNGGGTELAVGTVITTTQTIFVYAESGTTPNNCTDEATFEVTIYQKPEVDTPADVVSCGDYILPALTIGDYYTGADGSGTLLPAGTIISTTQDIFVYTNTGIVVECSDQHTFNVQIDTAPTTIPATTLEVCDDNFDTFSIFNLLPAGLEVIDGQVGLTVTYHETIEGAQLGENEILTPGNYLAITGQVFIRVIETGNTSNCNSIQPVNLIVHPRPAVPTIEDYALCDDNNSPDETETFDLTTKDIEVTGGLPGITVAYYTSQADAQTGDNPIANPATYDNTSTPQEIWAAAISDFGCRSISSFDIIVNPLPIVNPALEPFYSCEEVPGQGEFDFTIMDPIIIQGAAGYNVSYYENIASAQAGSNDYLTSPYTSPTTVIYARVVDDLTQCVTITEVELEVIPAPIAPTPAALEECDFNNDNVAIFNLDPVLQQIEALLGDVSVTIHETESDAIYFFNTIPNTSNYSNIEAETTDGIQTLYIRVQSTLTECFDVVTLQLIVHPVPVATIPADYELCDNGADDTDGIATFDLTTVEAEVLGTLDPALYSVAFYGTFAAAELGLTPIATPSSYNSTTDTIHVRVTNNATGCYDIVPLELIVNPLPVVNNPLPYTLCDENNPGDEIEIFDLTTQYSLIAVDPNGV
ncbi:choice-of-anchor L domain-containing protein, partial [uncultured Flavobacterium sp.]|uniref:choice-of-anchor L domain-containing protein n=2 Tax=Pseudomonadati TaxID=3379134 RepID=UPI0025F831DB